MSRMNLHEQAVYDRVVARIAQAERAGETVLNLSSLRLTEIPPVIGRLTSFRALRLGGNWLKAVPDSLRELTQLQYLSLRGNQLTAVPDWLGELTQLKELDLSGNQLTAVPDSLGELTQLQELNLSGNQLTTVPDSLGELTQLQSLSLSYNRLTAVPDSLRELTQLQELNLSGNQLTAVPDWLGKLTQLQSLDLGRNQLTAVPDWLRELTQLQNLTLDGNELTTVPHWLAEMPTLKELYIWGNPITQPPPEQLGEALKRLFTPVDFNALRRYFAQLRREGEAHFYEAKLLIVGEGGAGKTSLARKLQNTAAPLPPPEDSTNGIEIQTWGFPLDPSGFANPKGLNDDNRYHVNIWDFGGQTVYHATHQFFLTKRSVYVLVADTRRQQTDFYDWLKMQETFGGDSPIILLKNRNRQHGNDCVIENLPHLQQRFPNLKEIVELDLNKVPDEADWPELLRLLQKHFLALDHIGVPRPKTWVEMRKTLDADPRDTIHRDEYLALCAQHGIPDPADALQLSDYLHHLGDILHFQDDPILTDLVILKPTWALDAVYRVLDNKEIAAAHGQFTLADLRHLWHESHYHNHRDKLRRLMENFQLCYPLYYQRDTYIAPQLLDIKTPVYSWEGSADDLQLRYKYPLFMPRGILSRAIVALHHRIEDQRRVWRTGVILRNAYARAELLELRGEGEIRIRVSGGNRRDLLMEIVAVLDDLHRSFPNLRYDKLVPCRCTTCVNAPAPHFFRLEKLLERLQNRRETIECDNPPYAEVHIRSLIDDAILQRELRGESGKTIYHVQGDLIQGEQKKMTSYKRGDTFNMSGDFRGANVNVKSRLEKVQQTISALPHADEAAKAELQQLIAQLNAALQDAPADKTEDVEAVAQMAETLVDAASSEKPNKMMVQITGEGLKKAAENVAAVMPTVLVIATQIVTAVANLAR